VRECPIDVRPGSPEEVAQQPVADLEPRELEARIVKGGRIAEPF